jgi:hypothetical protein
MTGAAAILEDLFAWRVLSPGGARQRHQPDKHLTDESASFVH